MKGDDSMKSLTFFSNDWKKTNSKKSCLNHAKVELEGGVFEFNEVLKRMLIINSFLQIQRKLLNPKMPRNFRNIFVEWWFCIGTFFQMPVSVQKRLFRIIYNLNKNHLTFIDLYFSIKYSLKKYDDHTLLVINILREACRIKWTEMSWIVCTYTGK